MGGLIQGSFADFNYLRMRAFPAGPNHPPAGPDRPAVGSAGQSWAWRATSRQRAVTVPERIPTAGVRLTMGPASG